MAPRFCVRSGVLILVCLALAACESPTYAPSPHSVSAPAAMPFTKPPIGDDVFVTDQQSQELYLCHIGVCSSCHTVGSGNMGTSSSPSDGGSREPSGSREPAGSVFVANASLQKVLQFGLRFESSSSLCIVTHTYDDSGYLPNDVAAARGPLIAVTNEYTTQFGEGNITFYNRGVSKPSYVAHGLFAFFQFGAFDAHGNFFNDGIGLSGGAGVGVVPFGSKVDRATGISGVGSPAGIQIARDGTINIVDSSCPCIRIYRGKTHVGNVTLTGAVDPISLALNRKNDRVWVTDNSTGTVDSYLYPCGGKPVTVYNRLATAFGVSILPAPEPGAPSSSTMRCRSRGRSTST